MIGEYLSHNLDLNEVNVRRPGLHSSGLRLSSMNRQFAVYGQTPSPASGDFSSNDYYWNRFSSLQGTPMRTKPHMIGRCYAGLY